ncbi:MAG: alpha/beta hydrolase [Solobacterium sp.]|nr:alpha/beta hydrolase [Solobacterium sp.]
MNRLEFIEQCKGLSADELHEIAEGQRKRAAGRIPPEVQSKFRSLDNATVCEELNIKTAWGTSHLYLIYPKAQADSARPVFVNVHGGGWSLDHTERDIYFCRRIAVRTGCLVVDIDYVLAPEHPYPAAIEEIEALLNILPEILQAHNSDPQRVILCGQSAGGNLIGAVTQRRKVSADFTALAQILCYLPADNYNDHFNGGELDARGMDTEYYGFFYNRVFEERANHDVSLALSSPDELKGLMPTDIITAGQDNLKPEAERYYELLQTAGVETTYRCFENSRHGFLVNLYDEWQEGEDYVSSLVLKHLAAHNG